MTPPSREELLDAQRECANVRGLSREEALLEAVIVPPGSIPRSAAPPDGYFAPNGKSWPDPTPEMLDDNRLFDAIWQTIKTWDINVPHAYSGYCGASGNHVRAIYDSLAVQGPPMLDSLKRELRIGSDYTPRCQNCGDPITGALHAAGFCGTCREMGCTTDEPSP